MFGYILITLFGGIILYLPVSNSVNLSFIDSLFTSTSATCVTGLIVTSTPNSFTFFGEAVILTLIQIGGLGYMAIMGIFVLLLRDSLSIHERRMVKESMDLPTLDIKTVIYKIIALIFIVELIGAIILTFEFYNHGEYNWKSAIWFGIFHSISAFNNAGFSLFDPNMIGYQSNATVLITLSFLIIIGGLGYFVLVEIFEKKRGTDKSM